MLGLGTGYGMDKRFAELDCRPRVGNEAKDRIGRRKGTSAGEVGVGQSIAAVALVVADYDEAIAFFTQRLGFALVEDTPIAPGKRWVVVRPAGGGTALLLAMAVTPEQRARVGDQTGGRVFLFLQTDDFWRDYAAFRDRGVHFTEEPREEPYGTLAVFLDLCGNRWDLIQPRSAESEPGA